MRKKPVNSLMADEFPRFSKFSGILDVFQACETTAELLVAC
jgi:hypothetical protein